MKFSTRYQAKGKFHELRGAFKEFAGRISSNTALGVKGKFERFAGKVQGRIGKTGGAIGF